MRGWLIAFAGTLLAASAASAQGALTLDHYRPAETAIDGFALSRPVGLGHIGFGARLDVDYGLDPLVLAGAAHVQHQLTGHVGVALGLLERIVVSARLPVVLVMQGDAAAGDPLARGAGLGDVGLSARWVLFGHEEDEVFGIALQLESTLPTAEAADPAQRLAGESGVSFTPETVAELRFAPVRITANVGLRFRERAQLQRLNVQHELTWGVGVGVDIVEDFFDVTLEGYGATALDRFAQSDVSPLEAILGARVRPVNGMLIGVAGGLGIGDGYGSPAFRAILSVGWADELVSAPPRIEGGSADDDPDAETGRLTGGVAVGSGAGVGPGSALSARVGPRSRERGPSLDYGNLDRDGDRVVDARDACPLDREDFDEIQDSDGCPEEDADQDQVADALDMCPLTSGVANEDPACNGCPALACVSAAGQITITERVEFETGSDHILPQSEAVLTDVLSIIQTNEQITRVRIEGHTDDRGLDPQNLSLSRDRAASVARWLVEHGLDASRLAGWGCGEAHPIEPNRTRAGRQTNRRVEFHIIDPPTAGYVPREGCEAAGQ